MGHPKSDTNYTSHADCAFHHAAADFYKGTRDTIYIAEGKTAFAIQAAARFVGPASAKARAEGLNISGNTNEVARTLYTMFVYAHDLPEEQRTFVMQHNACYTNAIKRALDEKEDRNTSPRFRMLGDIFVINPNA